MTTESLRLLISSPEESATRENWLHLEQPEIPESQIYPSLRDVYKMWLRAMSGKSAMGIRPSGCPVQIVGSKIIVELDFLVWPSDPGLPYTLHAATGTIGSGTPTASMSSALRDICLFADNVDNIDYDIYLDNVNFRWLSPAWNQYGESIPPPQVTLGHTSINFSEQVFAGVLISGQAIGYKHTVSMVLDKGVTEVATTPDEVVEYLTGPHGEVIFTPPPVSHLSGYKISNLENTITATWMGTDGQEKSTQLRLQIPQCVQSLLEMCPDAGDAVYLCSEVATRQVYFSTCDGSVLAVVDGIDPQTFCAEIA